jgi:hypothetical protein
MITAFESPAVIAGFDDVAVVGKAIERRGRHLGVADDAGPFTECEVGGDDDRGRSYRRPTSGTEADRRIVRIPKS